MIAGADVYPYPALVIVIPVTAAPEMTTVPVAVIPPAAGVTPVGSAKTQVGTELYPEPAVPMVALPTDKPDVEVTSKIATLIALPSVPGYLAAHTPTEPSPAE